MTDLILSLRRLNYIEDGILGYMFLHDKAKKVTDYILRFSTLEPPRVGLKENANLALPGGMYNIELTKSHTAGNKDGYLPLIFNSLVPRHRRILIHAGNTPKDTQGCILLGAWEEDTAFKKEASIKESRKAMNELLNLLSPPLKLYIE